MGRDPAVLGRRLALLAAAALFIVIAVMNFSNLSVILAREEPRRSLRLALAACSLSLGSIMITLLGFDLRGRTLPLTVTLRPAWLIVGLNLIDEYIARQHPTLLLTGLLATAMGVWGGIRMFVLLRRKVSP